MAKKTKKQKKEEFPKVKEVIKKAKEAYTEIQDHEEKNKGKEESIDNSRDYKYWTIQIIDKLENNSELDRESYDNLVSTYPQVKSIIDELIEQVKIFSIYDNEPSKVNFDYAAYLSKIKMLIEN